MRKRYWKAILECRKAIKLNPSNPWARARLVATYIFCGQKNKARDEAQRILKIYPFFTIENFSGFLAYKDQKVKDRILKALSEAGLE